MKSHVKWILAGLLWMAGATEAPAQPDLGRSTVPHVVVCPNGLLTYQVTIRNAAGVGLPGLVVTLIWPPAAAALTCWCPAQPPPPLAALTGGNGTATFVISAGGCIEPAVAGTFVAVNVAGAPFTTVGQVSPDLVNRDGLLIADCRVGLSDAVWFSFFLANNVYSFCADINSDLSVGLTDAVFITQPIVLGSACR